MHRHLLVVFCAVVVGVFLVDGCAASTATSADAGMDAAASGLCGPGTAIQCNGTCTEVQTDVANCGTCGNQCPFDQVCSHGSCVTVCGGGSARCGNSCVNLSSDGQNCGSCNNACPSGEVCSESACAVTCQASLIDCAGSCVDTTQDNGNCGGCGAACPDGQVCMGGACIATCQSGWTACTSDAGGTCVDTQLDVDHCGDCNTACPSGYFCSPVKGVGTCGLACSGGTSLCGKACVDESIDNANCGGCGSVCSGTCSGGHCCATKGDIFCDGACRTLQQCVTVSSGQISAATGTVCAINSSGVLKCWGSDNFGELGDGNSNTQSNVPLTVSLGTGVKPLSIGIGGQTSCAVSTAGEVYCWGYGNEGQLADGNEDDALVPKQVSGITSATRVSVGSEAGCVVASGAIKCWGLNQYGEVGDGTFTERDAPVGTSITSGAIDVKASGGGGESACGIVGTGIQCWGEGDSGEIGDGSFSTDQTFPIAVQGITDAIAVSLGTYHACAILANATLQCWGANDYGELGDNTTTASDVPVLASVVTDPLIGVCGGWGHTCVLTTAGAVKCMGFNFDGQLGNGQSGPGTNSTVPVTAIASSATSIACGDYNTCALLANGKAMCWGTNSFGQLGNGTFTDSAVPVEVSGF